jgi:putative ABC transport system permease protein
VQMVAVGLVMALLLQGDVLIGVLILLLMTIAAAVTASRRLKGIAAPVLLSFQAIFAGAAVVIICELSCSNSPADSTTCSSVATPQTLG